MYPTTVKHERHAFTLIELILVLGVMVMIFSLAVPLATRALGTHSLRQSADLVRVAMGKARVKAIRSGEIHAMFFQINSGWYNIAPFNEIVAQEGIAARQQQLAATQAPNNFSDNRLPTGIQFASGIAVADGRSADAYNQIGSGSAQVQPILFYPDGTSQDATVYLKNDKQSIISVELRGLTGTAKTVRLTGQ